MNYLDLHAVEMEIAALQAEARRRGLPKAVTYAVDDFRTKFLPSLVKAREQQGELS